MSTVEVGTAKLTLTGDTTGLEVAIDRAKQKQAGLGAAAQAEANKMTAAQRKVVDSYARSAAAVGLDAAERLKLKIVMNTEGATRDALLARVKANTAAVASEGRAYEKTVNARNKYGLTGKQETAALRQVPAQLTDIFVSLQGGQNPLTVLLQQGGQLRDVFGGVRPVLAALGGELAKLVNPTTLVAGAFAALLVLQLKAEARINGFNQALILTGQSSRISADDLQKMALQLDNISGVTSRQAADALTQIAVTGKIAAGQFLLVAEAAARTQDATSKAMSETIAEYAEIARDPVSAILKLNDAEGFLTLAQFERIAALQDRGDIEAAAAMATELRATEQIARDQQIVASLGAVSGAWYGVKNSIGEAYDGVEDFFIKLDQDAKKSITGNLKYLSDMLASMKMGVTGAFGFQAALNGANITGAGVTPYAAPNGPSSAQLAQLRSIRQGNLTPAERQKMEEDAIISIKKLTKAQIDSDNDVIASRKAYALTLPKGASGAGAARSLANAEASFDLEAIKNREETARTSISNSTKLLQAEYSARLISSDAYYAQQRDLMQQDTKAQETSIVAQIAYLRERNVTGKDSVSVNKQIMELEQRLAKVRADSATQAAILGIQEKDLADKRREWLEDYKYGVDRQVEAIYKQTDAQLASIMYGEREGEKQAKLTAIYEAQTEALRKLQLQKDRKEITGPDFNDAAALEEERATRAADAVIDDYKRMDEAQASWLNGLRSGVADWVTQTQNVQAQMNQMTTRALDGTVDALTTLFTTGKTTFKELLADILKELTRFFAKQAVLSFIKMFAGSFMGGGDTGGGWSGSLTGNDSGNPFAGIGNGTIWENAKGGVYPGAAGLSAYSGKVVSAPTLFAFARGAGVMGEAGPEAIMPLQRGPNGKLGVQMYGGGSGSVVNISTTVNMETGETQTTTNNDQLKQFGDNMGGMIKQHIQKSMLPGGDLYAAGVRM